MKRTKHMFYWWLDELRVINYHQVFIRQENFVYIKRKWRRWKSFSIFHWDCSYNKPWEKFRGQEPKFFFCIGMRINGSSTHIAGWSLQKRIELRRYWKLTLAKDKEWRCKDYEILQKEKLLEKFQYYHII